MDAKTNESIHNSSCPTPYAGTVGERLLSWHLRRLVQTGCLVVRFPSGQSRTFGIGTPPAVTVWLKQPSSLRKLLLDPYLALGEAYMDGTLVVGNDDVYGLLALLGQNLSHNHGAVPSSTLLRLRRRLRGAKQTNTCHRARRNVAHHYDLSSDLYRLFLDEDWQYSCAYFRHPDDTLDTAQHNKKELIAKKLLLEPGHRLLDIGSGWGGLGLHLAGKYGAHVTGVTLSKEQLQISQRRSLATGSSGHASFHLQDYRNVEGEFDRIVSVGMFEHVGVPQYTQFFNSMRDRLAPDGVALLHTIGRTDGSGVTDPWIEKYIFPGGYCPALSEILVAIEGSGLYVTDIEVWRLHYAKTLQAWRERFEANLDEVRKVYDERFCRMWRYYLAASEVAFRHNGHVVFQIQLAKQQNAVPLTRDYLVNAGHRSAAGEELDRLVLPAVEQEQKTLPGKEFERV